MPASPPADKIFAEALLRAAGEERAAYLKEACGDHVQLLERVERLLRAHNDALSFLETPPSAIVREASPTLDQTIAEKPGTQIGPYKLLQQIGEGGMGVVYMAEQLEPVKRRVALKIIKPGMDTRQVIARFEAERQALSLMDHPNIAKVLDAGTTGEPGSVSSGRPYFVMELVKGQPITQYCDEKHFTPRQRLELLLPVCQAIQHAHQKGIIHRDIKPTNILVAEYDQQPVPKVIDFGVAKATSQALTEKTMFTGLGQIVGTLEYMSPEQAKVNQLDIDTRSDIYSLGVLLYELLTGSTPFDRQRLRSAAFDEMLRIIREEEPPKPSTRLSDSHDSLPSISAQRHTEPAKLTKLVRGELDWIVMKALEKDRNRRYETASGLAADIQRFLSDEAVLACPPSLGYLFRKFARRNKVGLATATLVLFFVVLLGGVIGWAMRHRAAREHEIALETARKLTMTEEGVRQALDRGTKSHAELHVTLRKPGGVQQLLNQRARWELLIKTAQGELAQARHLAGRAEGSLDAVLTQGLDNLEQQLASDQADFDLALRLEKIRLDRATVVENVFDNRKTADGYREALDGFAVLSEDPAAVAARIGSSPIKDQLVAALDDWAWVAHAVGEQGLVERLLAVARHAAPDPAWGDRLRQPKVMSDQEALGKLVAKAPAGLSPQLLDLVGSLLRDVNSPLAESWLRRAQAEHPADFWLNYDLAFTLRKTNPVEAAGFYRVALAVRYESSAAYIGLGNALKNQNRLDEALACYRRAIDLNPKSSIAYSNIGNVLFEQKKLDQAIAKYEKAIALDPKYANAHLGLGFPLKAQGKLDDAIAAFRKAVEADPKNAEAYMQLGAVLATQKKLEEAAASFRKAVELNPRDSNAHNCLGTALYEQRKLDEAIAEYRKAIELVPKSVEAHGNLGNTLHSQGKPDEAIAECRRAIELDAKYARAYLILGNALADQGKLEEAVAEYRKAIEINPKNVEANNNLGNLLRKQGKPDEAIAAYKEAIRLDPKLAVPHYNLGTVLYDRSENSAALAEYEEAIRLDPKYAWAYCGLGKVLRRQGKSEEAIAAFRKAVNVDAKLADAHYHLAWELTVCSELKLRDPKEALIAARLAVQLAPETRMNWQGLGYAEYRSGNWKEAVEAFTKVKEMGSAGDSIEWFPFSMAYWRVGDKEAARKTYDQAVQWMEKNNPKDGFLRGLQAEAAALMGIELKKE